MSFQVKGSADCPVERWIRTLIVSDAPDDWRVLVEQIVELEEMLGEIAVCRDADAEIGRPALERLLREKRDELRRIDVG